MHFTALLLCLGDLLSKSKINGMYSQRHQSEIVAIL